MTRISDDSKYEPKTSQKMHIIIIIKKKLELKSLKFHNLSRSEENVRTGKGGTRYFLTCLGFDNDPHETCRWSETCQDAADTTGSDGSFQRRRGMWGRTAMGVDPPLW